MVTSPITAVTSISLAVAALLALAAPSQAMIVPQQGMAGVKLGMNKSEVRSELGRPRAVDTGRNDFGSYTEYKYRGRITVTFQGGPTVTSIRTSGRGERTKKGVGVGSTEARVKEHYPNATCRTIARSRSCYLGELSPGRRVTDFNISDGKVKWVSVGFVID